jgi:recombination protein RecA
MGALTSALRSLKKNKNVDLKKVQVDLSDSQKPIPCIPTGSVVLDYLIGGYRTESGGKRCPGIPRGRITEIFGPEGSGKTTVAIQAAIRCQQEGGSVLFLDYEHAFAPTYAADLGLNVEDEETFMLMQPRHWEEGAEIIKVMIDAGVDLIIVDSLAAMKPQRNVEDNDVSATGQVGHIARLQSEFLPKVVGDVEQSGTSLIYINQLRSRIKTSRYDAGPDEETSGGRALKYYASLRISLKRVKTEYAQVENELTGRSEKQPISNIIRAKNVKNKVSKHQGHQAEFVIRYGEGIDNVRSVIDIGEARKVVKRSGAWYSFEGAGGEEVKAQGKEGLRTHLLETPDDFHALVTQIQSFSKDRIKMENVSDDDIIVEDIEAEEEEFDAMFGDDD